MASQELTKKLWVNKLRSTTAAADYATLIALLFIVISATAIWLPGAHWLTDYAYKSDFTFHPDEDRFVDWATHFEHPVNHKYYPLFMATQLFIINSFLHKIMHVELNSPVVLRCITLTYAILSTVFLFVFLRFLGFSRLVSILSSFFLAFAPLFIILSHFGTADMAAFFLFYLTIFAAWRYQVTNKEFWFHFAVASAGVAMAAKFYLPALVPPAIIILRQPVKKIWSSVFVSTCIFITFFSTASFFNFTPWDFKRLIDLLIYDNVLIEGGSLHYNKLFYIL